MAEPILSCTISSFISHPPSFSRKWIRRRAEWKKSRATKFTIKIAKMCDRYFCRDHNLYGFCRFSHSKEEYNIAVEYRKSFLCQHYIDYCSFINHEKQEGKQFVCPHGRYCFGAHSFQEWVRHMMKVTDPRLQPSESQVQHFIMTEYHQLACPFHFAHTYSLCKYYHHNKDRSSELSLCQPFLYKVVSCRKAQNGTCLRIPLLCQYVHHSKEKRIITYHPIEKKFVEGMITFYNKSITPYFLSSSGLSSINYFPLLTQLAELPQIPQLSIPYVRKSVRFGLLKHLNLNPNPTPFHTPQFNPSQIYNLQAKNIDVHQLPKLPPSPHHQKEGQVPSLIL